MALSCHFSEPEANLGILLSERLEDPGDKHYDQDEEKWQRNHPPLIQRLNARHHNASSDRWVSPAWKRILVTWVQDVGIAHSRLGRVGGCLINNEDDFLPGGMSATWDYDTLAVASSQIVMEHLLGVMCRNTSQKLYPWKSRVRFRVAIMAM